MRLCWIRKEQITEILIGIARIRLKMNQRAHHQVLQVALCSKGLQQTSVGNRRHTYIHT